MIDYSKKQIDALLIDIWAGVITIDELPIDLYNAIANFLTGSLTQLEAAPSKELLSKMITNLYEFSGAKTYQQINDISLLKEGGEAIKTFAAFKKEALNIYEQYNKDWMQSEYNTAIANAQNIVRWEQIEEQKKKLPYLTYSAVVDANTSDICAPLNGVCLPVDDPFWNTNAPTNHFNCRCILLQVDKEDSNITPKEAADKISDNITALRSPIFNTNVGKSEKIYDNRHPYYNAPQSKIDNNFGLPLPSTDE